MATSTKRKTEKKESNPLHKVDALNVVIRPRITEKTGYKSADNAYTFEVNPRSTKPMISNAIESLYGVRPVKIAIVAIRSKKKFLKGRRGVTAGGKKAYVYLKKGDTIQFV